MPGNKGYQKPIALVLSHRASNLNGSVATEILSAWWRRLGAETIGSLWAKSRWWERMKWRLPFSSMEAEDGSNANIWNVVKNTRRLSHSYSIGFTHLLHQDHWLTFLATTRYYDLVGGGHSFIWLVITVRISESEMYEGEYFGKVHFHFDQVSTWCHNRYCVLAILYPF